MPSKDTYHQKHPEVNEGLVSSDPARPRAAEGRRMSAQVLRLAQRLGSDPDELAGKIDQDTLRRTKYPVLEHVDEDGKRHFKHDTGIQDDARISLPASSRLTP